MARRLRQLGTIGDGAKLAPARQARVPLTFAQALQRERGRFNGGGGISYSDIAKKCSVPQALIRQWEEGTASPTRGEWGRLAAVMPRMRFYSPNDFAKPAPEHAEADEQAYQEAEPEIAPLPETFQQPRTFGDALRLEREAEGISVGELADVFRVSPVTAECWERNDRLHPEIVKTLISLFPRLEDAPAPSEYKPPEPVTNGEVRQMARAYVNKYDDPEERRARLEELHGRLTRGERRAIGIPSLEKIERSKPPPRPSEPELRECPRCHERFLDLAAHRDDCPKRRIPPPPPTMPTPRSPAPSEDVDRRKAAGAEAASSQAAEVSTTPPTEPDSEAPRVPAATVVVLDLAGKRAADAGRRDATFELCERCLVLADMLWPTGQHAFQLWEGAGRWHAAIVELGTPSATRVAGTGDPKEGAVHALADALRAVVEERKRSVAELAKLLED